MALITRLILSLIYASLNAFGKLTQSQNPQPLEEDVAYWSPSSIVFGTRDGSRDYPFATMQEAIEHFGEPVDLADYLRQVYIVCLDSPTITQNITLYTRRYRFYFQGGTLSGNWTQIIDNALRFGSTINPTVDMYSATRNLGTQIIGNLTIQLKSGGTAVNNISGRMTNMFMSPGNVIVADGTNEGASVTTGTASQFALINSSVNGTFLGRNVSVALETSSIIGNVEMLALLSATGASALFGSSITTYGTSTATRQVYGLTLLPVPAGVTWTNVNVEPRWEVDQLTLQQFTSYAVIAGNKIRFNVNVYSESSNTGATGTRTETYHNSSSPAANDVIDTTAHYGRDSAGNKTLYADSTVEIDVATNGSESATVRAYTIIAGVRTEIFSYGTDGFQFKIPFTTTGTVTGFTAGAGTAVLDDSTFTGDIGTTAYTIGDIVRYLKTSGQFNL
jgi:hypothetical protein